jgi:hypothetical protein
LSFFVDCLGAAERPVGQVGAPAAAGWAARTYELDVAGRDDAPMGLLRRTQGRSFVGWGRSGQLQRSGRQGVGVSRTRVPVIPSPRTGVVGMELMRGVDRGGLNQRDDRAEQGFGEHDLQRARAYGRRAEPPPRAA